MSYAHRILRLGRYEPTLESCLPGKNPPGIFTRWIPVERIRDAKKLMTTEESWSKVVYITEYGIYIPEPMKFPEKRYESVEYNFIPDKSVPTDARSVPIRFSYLRPYIDKNIYGNPMCGTVTVRYFHLWELGITYIDLKAPYQRTTLLAASRFPDCSAYFFQEHCMP